MTDGGNLRTQLESALQRIKEQEATLRSYEVREVLNDADFTLVTEADLLGQEGDLKELASEVQKQRLDQQKALLAKAGLDDEQVAQILSGEALESELNGSAVGGLGRLQSGTGKVPPRVDDSRHHGRSAIKAHFASDEES